MRVGSVSNRSSFSADAGPTAHARPVFEEMVVHSGDVVTVKEWSEVVVRRCGGVEIWQFCQCHESGFAYGLHTRSDADPAGRRGGVREPATHVWTGTVSTEARP